MLGLELQEDEPIIFSSKHDNGSSAHHQLHAII
jgi:hypothetical protein